MYASMGMKAVALVSVFMVSGCASIVSKADWPVKVDTNPSGAKCVIAKRGGGAVHAAETPFTVTLKPGGRYFSGDDYTITCEKPGFETAKAEMPCSLNGWYWGNIVFGGLIGLFIVDPLTGAMWRMDDTKIVTLAGGGEVTPAAAVAPAPAQAPQGTVPQ